MNIYECNINTHIIIEGKKYNFSDYQSDVSFILKEDSKILRLNKTEESTECMGESIIKNDIIVDDKLKLAVSEGIHDTIITYLLQLLRIISEVPDPIISVQIKSGFKIGIITDDYESLSKKYLYNFPNLIKLILDFYIYLSTLVVDFKQTYNYSSLDLLKVFYNTIISIFDLVDDNIREYIFKILDQKFNIYIDIFNTIREDFMKNRNLLLRYNFKIIDIPAANISFGDLTEVYRFNSATDYINEINEFFYNIDTSSRNLNDYGFIFNRHSCWCDSAFWILFGNSNIAKFIVQNLDTTISPELIHWLYLLITDFYTDNEYFDNVSIRNKFLQQISIAIFNQPYGEAIGTPNEFILRFLLLYLKSDITIKYISYNFNDEDEYEDEETIKGNLDSTIIDITNMGGHSKFIDNKNNELYIRMGYITFNESFEINIETGKIITFPEGITEITGYNIEGFIINIGPHYTAFVKDKTDIWWYYDDKDEHDSSEKVVQFMEETGKVSEDYIPKNATIYRLNEYTTNATSSYWKDYYLSAIDIFDGITKTNPGFVFYYKSNGTDI